MPNYQNGKIYSIRSHSRPDLVYVGSTTQPLSKRFGEHKTPNSKIKSSKQITDLGDAYIELIENYSCNSKEELLKREGEIIRSMDCVNKAIAGRTPKEWREDNIETIKEKIKQYHQDNADKIKEQTKQYRQDNIDSIKKRDKQYKKENADTIKQYKKQYYQDNIDKLKQKLECDCGGEYIYKNKSQHFKSKKHKLYQEIYDYIYS
jgi:hypothetical protein